MSLMLGAQKSAMKRAAMGTCRRKQRPSWTPTPSPLPVSIKTDDEQLIGGDALLSVADDDGALDRRVDEHPHELEPRRWQLECSQLREQPLRFRSAVCGFDLSERRCDRECAEVYCVALARGTACHELSVAGSRLDDVLGILDQAEGL